MKERSPEPSRRQTTARGPIQKPIQRHSSVVTTVGLALGVEDALPIARLEISLRIDVHLDLHRSATRLALENGQACGLDDTEEDAEGEVRAPRAFDRARPHIEGCASE